MIKHFCFIEADDYRVIRNPTNPFYGMTHDTIVTEFNKRTFNKDDELLHNIFDLTQEIAFAAVKMNGNVLESIHPDLFSKQLCLDALASRSQVALIILKSKKMLDDDEMLHACVKVYPECISVIGDKQTEELCKIAVMESPSCLQYVIDQTLDVCDIALRRNARSIQYIRKPLMHQYVDALCNDPGCITSIPDRQLVHVVDSLSTEGKIKLLTSFTGNRRESGSSLQDDRLKFLRKDWRATNIHATKQ